MLPILRYLIIGYFCPDEPWTVIEVIEQLQYNKIENQLVYNKETRKAIDHYSYALNEEIGQGFSSHVYKGRDENNQQPVAVKVIDMKMVKQSIHAVLLKNEISALKSFNSKNILKLFDVFQTANNTYLITEYCDSGDLSNRIKKRGRVEEAEAVRILREIVAGLYEINQKGFIHRDIKPANILMEGMTPKIADFGFAVQLNSNDARSQSKHFNVGTPLYMSPQALRQQGHSEKGDVWAMGVMYFEMLYGRPPFTAQSEAALLSNILHQGIQIPAHPYISDQSKDLIRRCLQVDENKRFRVKDIYSHSLIANDKFKLPSQIEPVYERVPLIQMNTNNPNYMKDKRSHSQGVREVTSKPIRTDIIPTKKNNELSRPDISRPSNQNIFMEPQISRQNKRTPTDVSNLQIEQKLDSKDYVGRSKSQKHMMLDNKILKDVPISPIVNNIKRQQSYETPSINTEECLSRRAPVTKQNVQVPKFKGNNDLLFSQINFCRFLYKFSQQLSAGAKTNPRLLTNNNLRDKVLFIMSKNIVMKISRLSQLNEKENHKENTFQLEDFDQYRKSESFGKFSQAIWEYNEKYKKHYEKMFQCIQKNGHQGDKKFEAIFDRDMNEFDSFYLISQSFMKQAQSELFNEIPKTGDADTVLPPENQFPLWVIENLQEYNGLIQMILSAPGDYKYFLRNSRVETLVDKKPKKYTYRDLNQMQQRAF